MKTILSKFLDKSLPFDLYWQYKRNKDREWVYARIDNNFKVEIDRIFHWTTVLYIYWCDIIVYCYWLKLKELEDKKAINDKIIEKRDRFIWFLNDFMMND